MRDPRISPHDSTCAGGAVTERPGNRGDVQIACPGCGRWAFLNDEGRVIPKPSNPTVVAIPKPSPKPRVVGVAQGQVGRFTLACIDCDQTIRVPDRRPRTPLCGRCQRARQRAERAQMRQAAFNREARRAMKDATQ